MDPAKVRDYLLSSEHAVGRSKARFFTALGFARTEWRTLREALLALALTGDATPTADPELAYGQKYEVRGMLQGPGGRSAPVVTIWIVLAGEDAPRLVTAYPGDTP